MTPQAALKKAIKLAGGPSALARKLPDHIYNGKRKRLTRQAIEQWKICPAMWALQIDLCSDTGITRHDLRPDLYPDED